MKRLPWVLLVFILLFMGSAGSVHAQQPTPSDDEVNVIAAKLFCPVCENTPLDVCPTQACAQWRDEIRLRLAQGWNEDQIQDYFVENYGARVLAEPPRQGLNWLVYIVPPVAFMAGAFILFLAFRSWQKLSKQLVEDQTLDIDPEESDPYLAKLEEELKEKEDR